MGWLVPVGAPGHVRPRQSRVFSEYDVLGGKTYSAELILTESGHVLEASVDRGESAALVQAEMENREFEHEDRLALMHRYITQEARQLFLSGRRDAPQQFWQEHHGAPKRLSAPEKSE